MDSGAIDKFKRAKAKLRENGRMSHDCSKKGDTNNCCNGSGGSEKSERKCFVCDKPAHVAKDCEHPARRLHEVARGTGSSTSTSAATSSDGTNPEKDVNLHGNTSMETQRFVVNHDVTSVSRPARSVGTSRNKDVQVEFGAGSNIFFFSHDTELMKASKHHKCPRQKRSAKNDNEGSLARTC